LPSAGKKTGKGKGGKKGAVWKYVNVVSAHWPRKKGQEGEKKSRITGGETKGKAERNQVPPHLPGLVQKSSFRERKPDPGRLTAKRKKFDRRRSGATDGTCGSLLFMMSGPTGLQRREPGRRRGRKGHRLDQKGDKRVSKPSWNPGATRGVYLRELAKLKPKGAGKEQNLARYPSRPSSRLIHRS